MINLINFSSEIETILRAINDVLIAGVAITAFSLLIFTFAYRLRDRLTFSFTLILVCTTIIYATAAFALILQEDSILALDLRLFWIGIVLLPAGYFNLSDALLTFTGKPSRGRRRVISILTYLVSGLFLLTLTTNWLVNGLVTNLPPAPFLQRSFLSGTFTVYFGVIMVLSWYNMVRAVIRSVTPTSRRRMLYLVIGAFGPVIGSLPFLMYGTQFAAQHGLLLWLISVLINVMAGIFVVIMSYAVAFYGYPWPDRVIKSRLFRWILRGPITASLTLGATTLVRRLGDIIGVDVSAIVVLIMVGMIVLLEYLIILVAPLWERIFFTGADRQDLEVIRSLEDRMITQNDLRQFQEMILAVICDRVQARGAFLTALNTDAFTTVVEIGKTKITNKKYRQQLYRFLVDHPMLEKQVEWQSTLLIALYGTSKEGVKKVIGVIGVNSPSNELKEEEQQRALNRLASRAALALKDRSLQEDLLVSLELLTPQVSVIQDLLAAGRYDRGQVLSEEIPLKPDDINRWVKDALTHLWGGPKLSQSPLLQLFLVQKLTNENDAVNPVNILREVLRNAIQAIRPAGERQYTNEWILFNLMDLKFIEGLKVKDIARRLALSEADLYRKQRIAISAVSKQLIAMEELSRKSQ